VTTITRFSHGARFRRLNGRLVIRQPHRASSIGKGGHDEGTDQSAERIAALSLWREKVAAGERPSLPLFDMSLYSNEMEPKTHLALFSGSWRFH
jgi:hypothetical protein